MEKSQSLDGIDPTDSPDLQMLESQLQSVAEAVVALQAEVVFLKKQAFEQNEAMTYMAKTYNESLWSVSQLIQAENVRRNHYGMNSFALALPSQLDTTKIGGPF